MPKNLIYKTLNDAYQDDSFVRRIEALSMGLGSGMDTIFSTSEYLFDRQNKVKYHKRFPKHKPTKMKWSEIDLCWRLMDKDIRIRELEKKHGKR